MATVTKSLSRLGLGAAANNGVFVDQAGGRGDFSHEVLLVKGGKSTISPAQGFDFSMVLRIMRGSL